MTSTAVQPRPWTVQSSLWLGLVSPYPGAGPLCRAAPPEWSTCVRTWWKRPARWHVSACRAVLV